MGYHNAVITKGEYGTFSKIQEEYEEARDALTQANPVMVLLELSDLIGAIEGYAATFNVTLADLLKMKEATHRAFTDGTRGCKYEIKIDPFVTHAWTANDLADQLKIYTNHGNPRWLQQRDNGCWSLKVITTPYSTKEMVKFLNNNFYRKN